VRLSAQDDFGVPARTLADGRFSTPAAFVQADRRNSLGQLSAAYFDYLEPAQHTGELPQQFNSI
jgi:hypothetical protein